MKKVVRLLWFITVALLAAACCQHPGWLSLVAVVAAGYFWWKAFDALDELMP